MPMRKFPARYAPFLLPLVISIFMSCMVSGVATFHTLGFAPGVFHSWMAAWGLSWVIAFPTLMLVLPVARRIVLMITEPSSN